MPEDSLSAEDKEKRRKKQYKRMSKILGKVWELDDSTNCFQDRPSDLQNHNGNKGGKDSIADGAVFCLSDIGQKIDNQSYRYGRHGWEDFAEDLGGVYNLHIRSSRRSKTAPLAKKHLDVVCELLGSIEASLVKVAIDHTPEEPSTIQATSKMGKGSRSNSLIDPDEAEDKKLIKNNKKRKQDVDGAMSNHQSSINKHDNNTNSNIKKTKVQHSNKNSDLAERETRAMDLLCAFVEENGADRSLVSGYRSRVTKKQSSLQSQSNTNHQRYDVVYYNESGRRFRSMLEVGRFLKIIKDGGKNGITARGSNFRNRSRGLRNQTSKEQDIETKRIRKEIEKLRKTHDKVTKTLEDFVTTRSESRYPMDDRMLIVEDATTEASGVIKSKSNGHEPEPGDKIEEPNYSEILRSARVTCAGAYIPDTLGFSGIPQHCTPDLLMTWDFLCTSERALSLSPIALDDFASALVYVPPDGQTGDDIIVPPVYLVEAHLSLLKLLLQDRTSDDWWWSTLESNEREPQPREAEFDDSDETDKGRDEKRPVIKFNIAEALGAVEDPLITTSWMRELEHVDHDVSIDKKGLKRAIKAALKFLSNKWVAAYLRKVLDLLKSQGLKHAKRATQYLVNTFLEARPDLGDRAVHKETINKARARVIEEVNKLMESLPDSIPTVTEHEVISDFELDDESDNDESDDEYQEHSQKKENGCGDILDESKQPASSIPPKPLPSLVDLLLPPAKPKHNSEFLDAFTWSHLVGATAARYIHRRKRLLNEIDDSIRDAHVLRPLVVSERMEREKLVASRILTECGNSEGSTSPPEKAIEHLCMGGNYLDLSPIERLSLLRLLIEASYDTVRVLEVVSSNYKQRATAMKSLEIEQRRAKKEAKEKSAADEVAAREHLAAEARDNFLDAKREEIRELNEKSKEFTDDVIESLTDEDIIDFDDDIRAEYDALPSPESFSKTEVAGMIRKIQQQSAFDTDVLRVLTLSELNQREKVELEEMEGQLSGFGGEEALYNHSLDRETLRSIERLQRDIERAKSQAEKLPILRQKALEQLADAIQNGTVKVLRSAFNAAKKAKLCGVDDETGGVWAVDLMRDAALELENAKQNKRLLDAQRDLVAKLKKCFIRTEPIGHDRCGNRFWMFDTDEFGYIWAEAEFDASDASNDARLKSPPGFLDLSRNFSDLAIGANDMEDDLVGSEPYNIESFLQFSRLEYHSSGKFPCLAKSSWGCHTNEDSLRAVIKQLDSRGTAERELKDRLKESLEHMMGLSEKNEVNENANAEEDDQGHENDEVDSKDTIMTSNDDEVFLKAKDEHIGRDGTSKDVYEHSITTAIGACVRIRKILDETRSTQIARYENGAVTGWKLQKKVTAIESEDSDVDKLTDSETLEKILDVPVWRVKTENGHVAWLEGAELLQSLALHKKWSNGHGYFEHDSAFLAYRNNLGRFCGKSSEAPYASSPSFFAKLMMKREAELYIKLKFKSYDNNWGGQSGSRALWTNSMKDYAYDFQTVRQGLLTLENAFFELSGKFTEYPIVTDDDEFIDGKVLLNDPTSRFEIELESIEKGVAGLWNSPASRAVYIAIVSESKTTGILALALDLLVRNTIKYLHTHKLLNSNPRSSRSGGRTDSVVTSYKESVGVSGGSRPIRSTRRMNTWQQKQHDDDDNDDVDNYSDEDWK